MAILKRTVFVRDPVRHRDIILRAGEEPAPEYATLVTNPDAWEDGKTPADADDSAASGDDTKPAAPAAKKTAAKKTASAPARGRNAADEGDSGK